MRRCCSSSFPTPLAMTTTSAPQPGDRPSGNILATRSPAVGRHGMIATSQSLASAAGLEGAADGRQRHRRRGHRRRGARRGRAVDERHRRRPLRARLRRHGRRQLHALDASGRAPRGRHAAGVRPARTHRDARQRSAAGRRARASSADGTRCSTRFGTVSMAQALAPAIGYARDGFPVAELMADEWRRQPSGWPHDPGSGPHVPARWQGAGDGRDLQRIRGSPRASTHIATDGRARSTAARSRSAIAADMTARDGLLTARRPRRSHRRLGRDHQHELPRRRRPRDAAQHPGASSPSRC